MVNMKKIVGVLLLLVVSTMKMMLFSQSDEPLKFKGIPIKGNVYEFCRALEKKGFEKYEFSVENTFDGYVGIFLEREAIVSLAADEENNIHSLVVLFKPYTDWKYLYEQYTGCVELYTAKYGEPVNSVAEKPEYATTERSMMLALEEGLVKYMTEYETKTGYIEIYIQKLDALYNGTIAIVYRDRETLEKVYEKCLEDI